MKERNGVSPLTDFDIPSSFWYELKSLTEALMDNVKCELLETEGSAPSRHDELPPKHRIHLCTFVQFGMKLLNE